MKPELVDAYADLIAWWNHRVNLVSRQQDPMAIRDHVRHCLVLAARPFPPGSVVVDFGTGGGLPAIPLAASMPDVRVIAVAHAVERLDSSTFEPGDDLRLTRRTCVPAASANGDRSAPATASQHTGVAPEDRDRRRYKPRGASDPNHSVCDASSRPGLHILAALDSAGPRCDPSGHAQAMRQDDATRRRILVHR